MAFISIQLSLVLWNLSPANYLWSYDIYLHPIISGLMPFISSHFQLIFWHVKFYFSTFPTVIYIIDYMHVIIKEKGTFTYIMHSYLNLNMGSKICKSKINKISLLTSDIIHVLLISKFHIIINMQPIPILHIIMLNITLSRMLL